MSSERQGSQGKRIYLLPNLFTTAGLFAGFYAIVAAMKGLFGIAVVAIFIAMISDGLDGRVARLTNTQSDFGKEYDSLADMVTFGIAPALVVYSWSLINLGKLGWLASFLFVAGAALRLALFNTKASGNGGAEYFRGVSSPGAAGFITSLVWLGHEYNITGSSVAIYVGILTVMTAGLMVSNIKYYSFKTIDLKGHVPFVVIVGIVLLLTCIAIEPPLILAALFSIYLISGPLLFVWNLRRRRKLKVVKKTNNAG